MRPIAEPPYLRIADELRRAILGGELAPGSKMPSLADIAEQFSVSAGTAFRASQVLLNEGLTTSKPGAGAYVRERPEVVRLTRDWYREHRGGSPWHADMAAQGRVGGWESHSDRTQAPPAIAERLHIESGDRVMRTAYLFTADGYPTYLSTSWEPLAITGGTPILLPEEGPYAGRGVSERMAAIGQTVTRAVEEIVPRTLTAPEAEQLRLRPGIAIVEIQRTYWSGEIPVETADIVIPPPYRPRYEIPTTG